MRLFKHGDTLAVVIPENLRKKFNLKENQDFEFFELEDGVLVMFNRETLAKQVKNKTLLDLARLAGSGFGTAGSAASAAPSTPAIALPNLMVFANEIEAKEASRKFSQELKRGDLIGVTGTDKKVYVLSSAFYSTIAAKLAPLLEKEKTLLELCKESNLPQKDVFPVLQAMKDKGDAIEKKKGVYLAVK